MRKLLLSLCLLPALALANPSMHEDGGVGDMAPHHGHRQLPRILHQLDLTDKQQDELKALFKTHHADIESKIKEIRSVDADIERLSFSSDYSDSKLQPLLDKANALHKETRLQKAKLDNAIFKLLTGEQQKQLQSQLEK